MSANAESVIALVEGAAAAITAELEEAIPGPWGDKMRETVREFVEEGIGPVVANIVRALVETRGQLGGDAE